MKTTFSRLFTIIASLILLCLLLLGVTFRTMLSDYLETEKQQTLHNNAASLLSLAEAYDAIGELENRWGGFRIGLTTAARVAGTDVLFCDPEGNILLCSCNDIGCIHSGKTVDRAMIDEIVTDGEDFTVGTVGGIYDSPHFVEGMAVTSRRDGSVIGVIIVSAAKEQISGMLMQTTTIFFYVSLLVLVVAMIAAFLFSRSQARSIQSVAKAAIRFGHGELDTRVAVGGRNTVEVDDLATAFNAMAESLATAETQRREFVANVSHELKTPMTTIAGFMDGMLDGTIPPEQHRHYMQIVSDEVRRLSRLVRSMLEISRMQSQGISEEKKRRFDLTETIGQVLISFEQRINRKHIHVEVQMPDRSVYTRADPDSITQVVYNLTDNAIKFCNEGGMLRISLEQEGGKARVAIQNTGPTVDPEELPLLFDRFHKADKSRSEDREGVGLGLYIVKTILNSHGEDISVTSDKGLTTFTFTLPVVR